MDTLAGDAMPPLSDLTGRSFVCLDPAERDRLRTLLRPLPWIDGLIAACVIAPVMPSQTDEEADWLDFVWSQADENQIGKLTLRQTEEIQSQLMDNLCYVANTLSSDPDAYQPYLGDFGTPVEAAANWANGFLYGTLLCRAAWVPLFRDEDALTALVAIFGLIRDEDLPEDVSADSPFRDMPPDRREQMRGEVVELLPRIVVALHEHALGLLEDEGFDPARDDANLDEAGLEGPEEPCIRAGPKVGRNEPCPCGSGKKYKKCCLDKPRRKIS